MSELSVRRATYLRQILLIDAKRAVYAGYGPVSWRCGLPKDWLDLPAREIDAIIALVWGGSWK